MDGDDDLAALAGLDLALDELAAGRDLPAGEVAGNAADLAALAADLRAAVPAPPPEAAERGRAAFLAAAAGGRPRGRVWRRSLPLRLAAVAAALVVLVALPAAARQADPGTALWPVRSVGQQVRDRLTDDPVDRARLRLNTAADYLAAAERAGEEGREDMADAAEEKIEAAVEALKDLSGPQVAAVRARATQLEAQVEKLERQKDADDRSGSGGETEPGDDRSGPGGDDDRSDDDPADDDNSGPGGGDDDGGSGKGSSGSGSGSQRSGSDDG
jgi:polyhydroxyalkanoate synthesis regulator phasin